MSGVSEDWADSGAGFSGQRRGGHADPSVLVDVIAMLVVPVTVVQMVDVVLVLDRLAAISVLVRTPVLRVHLALRVLLTTVEMVHVVVVPNRFASVIRQVLVVQFLSVRVHENSSGCWILSFLPQSLRRQEWTIANGEAVTVRDRSLSSVAGVD